MKTKLLKKIRKQFIYKIKDSSTDIFDKKKIEETTIFIQTKSEHISRVLKFMLLQIIGEKAYDKLKEDATYNIFQRRVNYSKKLLKIKYGV